jgi:uncharacterized protein (TIGR03118 family)
LSGSYLQTNLVSDISGIARVTDPNLVNPWGIAYSPSGPFMISDNNAGVATAIDGNGQPFPTSSPLVINIPPPAGSPPGTAGTPTGTVFNTSPDFDFAVPGTTTGPSIFIFATEDGTIAGWNSGDGTNAVIAVDNSAKPTPASGAVYKGLAIGNNGSGNFLYATNFRAGTIDVFDRNFAPATLTGAFSDPSVPAGFAPFGIQNIGGKLFVTYAKQNAAKHDDVAGAGNGFVDVFDTNGNLMQRLIVGGNPDSPLNSPWGLAPAPANFGQFSNDLLVGNFGDGRINAFDPNNGTLLGQLLDQTGTPITIGGLWGLKFGNGGQAGSATTLFFTAGIGDEQHGLFGTLQVATVAHSGFRQTNLVSDISGIARVTDDNLLNPWGVAYSPTGPFWIADNNAGVSTVYDGNGQPFPSMSPLVVSIPPPPGSPPGAMGTPTGAVFNGTSDFAVPGTTTGPSLFLFATEDGTIASWNRGDGTSAVIAVDNSAKPTPTTGAVYKGLALASNASGNFLFAANFRAGTIDVFDKSFAPATLSGSFSDLSIPAGFAPFDIQNIGGQLFVTYAKQNAAKHDDVAGAGNGFVDVFDTNGNLLQRLIVGGVATSPLNSPWGLALAPAGFGRFSNDLLVGNFGDGRINAFNPKTGAFRGTLADGSGNPITIGGLWALKFGNGGLAGSTSTLFFTAGIGDEQHGLFGTLVANRTNDVTGRVSSSGQWWTGVSNGSSFNTSLWTTWSPAATWVDVQTGDFNHDGHDDIVGRVLQTGQWWVGISNGSSGFTTTLWGAWNPAVTWADVKVGDFDGDGTADIIGRVQETGQWWAALSTGSSFTNSLWATWNPSVTWVDVNVGDFDGDGKADITGRVMETGQWWTGLSTGSSFNTSFWTTWNPAVTWVDVQVGDFDGDGKMDIAGRVLQSGQWWTALSSGTSFSSSLWAAWNSTVTWADVHTGDFA